MTDVFIYLSCCLSSIKTFRSRHSPVRLWHFNLLTLKRRNVWNVPCTTEQEIRQAGWQLKHAKQKPTSFCLPPSRDGIQWISSGHLPRLLAVLVLSLYNRNIESYVPSQWFIYTDCFYIWFIRKFCLVNRTRKRTRNLYLLFPLAVSLCSVYYPVMRFGSSLDLHILHCRSI